MLLCELGLLLRCLLLCRHDLAGSLEHIHRVLEGRRIDLRERRQTLLELSGRKVRQVGNDLTQCRQRCDARIFKAG